MKVSVQNVPWVNAIIQPISPVRPPIFYLSCGVCQLRNVNQDMVLSGASLSQHNPGLSRIIISQGKSAGRKESGLSAVFLQSNFQVEIGRSYTMGFTPGRLRIPGSVQCEHFGAGSGKFLWWEYWELESGKGCRTMGVSNEPRLQLKDDQGGRLRLIS